MKLSKDKMIVISLIGLLVYTVQTSRSSKNIETTDVVQTTSHKSNRQIARVKKDEPIIQAKSLDKDEDQNELDPSYLAFAEKRKAYQNSNNQEGYTNAGADPFANTTINSNLKEEEYLETQYAEIAERDEDFATEELDWDQYTGAQDEE